MSGTPKIIKTITVVGTAIGFVVIIVGNAFIATSRGGSAFGLALRSLGLLLALIALGTFLCVSVGSRIYRDIMRRMDVANKARQQRAMETMMSQNLSAIPADPPPPLVTLGRVCAVLLLVLSAIAFLVSCVQLAQASAGGWTLLYFFVQSARSTILLLTAALLLWIAAEVLNKSAQNRRLLILLLQQREATGPGVATTNGTSLAADSNSDQTTGNRI